MARPPRPIDPEQVFKVARLGCTNDEVADFFGLSERQLRRRFRPVLVRARAAVRISIRRAQFLRATRDRSDKMLIHLGKCELGQRPGSGAGDTLHSLVDELLERGGGDDDESTG
jgi:hypothetical protein